MENLAAALKARRAAQLYRRRRVLQSPQGAEVVVDGKPCLNFCSNDYLGLANHPQVVSAFQQGLSRYGAGSGASHLVCGHSAAHEELEEALAHFSGRPRALLFSTGYMANLGVVQALAGRGDGVYEDRLNHASLLDAALLSRAALHRFRHRDAADLAERLAAQQKGRKLVAVDGVFSMDGDLSPLPELAAAAARHDAWLMVDDAHGLGVLGERGAGSVEHSALGTAEVPILMGTLGKALGVAGAFVAGSETLVETLLQFARTSIYTTALPPAQAAAVLAALRLVSREEAWRREQLHQRVRYFREKAAEHLPLAPSETPIQPLVVGASDRSLELARKLLAKGLWITAIRPPTVPEGTARLRITLSAAHSEAHIDRLLEALAALWP